MENTNLGFALAGSNVDTGTVRETFLLNQLKENHQVILPNHGDFLIDGEITIEVGGKSKNNYQIKDTPNAYIAMNDILIRSHNRIPLWLFGFL